MLLPLSNRKGYQGPGQWLDRPLAHRSYMREHSLSVCFGLDRDKRSLPLAALAPCFLRASSLSRALG